MSRERTQFLRPQDVAEIMDCRVGHIYTAINHGDLVAYRDSVSVAGERMPWRIKKRDFKTWLERHKQKDPEEYAKEYALSRLRSAVVGIRLSDEDEWDGAIRGLPPRVQHVLICRYGLEGPPRTLSELSEELGISRERVRQLQREGERKLKDRISGYR